MQKNIAELAKEVGKRLKEARNNQGLTMLNVATHLGQVVQQYATYESGRYQLNYDQIVTLCKLLDITPNDLFGF